MLLYPGMVFDPSDGEIVSHYLPKLIADSGDVKLGGLSYVFTVCDVYSCRPWLLFEHERLLPFMKGNQRFVFSSRQKIARKNLNGKRPRRTLQSESEGYWKSSTGEKPIFDDEGRVIGYVNMLNFYDYRCEKNNQKDGSKTDWIMYEYRLPGPVFQEWVICKVKNTSFPEADEYEDVWLRQLFFEGNRSDQTSNIDQDCPSSNLWELGFEQPSDQTHAIKALRQWSLLEPEVTAVEVHQSRLSAAAQVAEKSCNNIAVDNHTRNEVETQHQHVLKDLIPVDQSLVMNKNDTVSDCQPSNHHQSDGNSNNMISETSEAVIVSAKSSEVDYQSWFSELMMDDYIQIPNEVESNRERVLIASTMHESSEVMKKKNNPIPDCQSSNNLVELGELSSNNHQNDGNMILARTSEAAIFDDQRWTLEAEVEEILNYLNADEADTDVVDYHIHTNSK